MVVQYIFNTAVPFLRIVYLKKMRAVIAVGQYTFMKVHQNSEIVSSAITLAPPMAVQSISREIIIQKLHSGRFLITVILRQIV